MISMRQSLLHKNFLANVREAAKRQGMRQYQLAELSGVHPVNVCRIMAGQVVPSFFTIERLAHALQIDPAKIFLPPRKAALDSR